jgi:DNA-binding NarL/FixJ family response regulator
MTLLIVDDNASIRRMLRRAVASLTTDVFECADGFDAVAYYKDHRPDVVLMDVRMPGLDGILATRQIRDFHPDARVVMVTDYDDAEILSAAFDAGASGYALKQDLTDLTTLIMKATRHAK